MLAFPPVPAVDFGHLLPIGTAFVLPTNHPDIPFLAHAPTMRVPSMRRQYGEYLVRPKDEAYRNHVLAYIEKEDTPRSLWFQLDLLRQVRAPDWRFLRWLAHQVIFDDRRPIRRVYISQAVVSELAEMSGHRSDTKVGEVAKVRPVTDLDSLIRELWPRVFECR